ncbi:MAG: hypothetical protein HY429_02495 [Candidatus Levybacteria bacterium]|nr:hypothetical protein [Candidatus Levybacteria bacterium]
MYTLLKPLLVREELRKKNIYAFSPWEFERLFGLSKDRAKYFLEEESKRGLFLRLKKGLYTLQTDMPGEQEIANKLYQPSYLSFEYALTYYGIMPEMVYSITSATTKPTREFDVQGRAFSYSAIKRHAFTGYQLLTKGGRNFFIAEPEKALVDYLYFVSLGKRGKNDRLSVHSLEKQKALFYATLFERKRLSHLVEDVFRRDYRGSV